MARRANQDTFDAVDAFVTLTLFAAGDEILGSANADAAAAGLPEIQVTPPQARLLDILCRTVGASRILEFGTLAGYSTIVMARTLPTDGTLTTLEYDPDHAEVAWDNIERAGLADKVDLRVGAALETLPLLESEGAGPFDFVFIDADKINTPAYFVWALDHTRPGGLIFTDNVIRDGGIVDPDAGPDCAAQRTSTNTWAKSPGSSRRRSRPSGRRATTGSRWRSSSPEAGGPGRAGAPERDGAWSAGAREGDAAASSCSPGKGRGAESWRPGRARPSRPRPWQVVAVPETAEGAGSGGTLAGG